MTAPGVRVRKANALFLEIRMVENRRRIWYDNEARKKNGVTTDEF